MGGGNSKRRNPSPTAKPGKVVVVEAKPNAGGPEGPECHTLHHNIKDLLYNPANLPLAKPGTDHLPPVVRATGFLAIAQLASAVLSTFKDKGCGVKLRGCETEKLQDIIGISKTLADSLEWDEFSDVAAFVNEIVRCIKLNTILVGAAALWWEGRKNNLPIEMSTEESEELRLSVFWCFLLHAVAKKALFQPRGTENCALEQLVTGIQKKREQLGDKWKEYATKFEKMKAVCFDKIMKRHLDLKMGLAELDKKPGGGLNQSLNILMAMYSDIKHGHDANAEAGFELMSEWKDQLPIKGLGNNIDMDYVHNGAPLGIKRITPPLPTEWANLYSSWNLDFVTGLYPCVPMMWAKLLAPVVLGTYHELDPGLYMAPRIFALYMTIQYQIFTVVDSGIHTNSKVRYYQMPLADGTLREHTNWEIKLREVSDLWGDINQEAAKQLNDRIGQIINENYGIGFEVYKGVKRAGFKGGWAIIKGMIKTFLKVHRNKKKKDRADAEGEDEYEIEDEEETAFVSKLEQSVRNSLYILAKN